MRRKIAYEVLLEVIVKDKHAHLVLKELELDPQDQAFVSALVYTSLQNYLFLDYQIDDLIKKNTDLELRILLIMALAQKYFMSEIPDYALVNEHVDLSKKVSLSRYSGLVNAVLKKIIKRGQRELPEDPIHKLSIEKSMPIWILRLLSAQYSFEFAQEYAEYSQGIKENYVRRNPKFDTVELDEYLEMENGFEIAKGEFFQKDFLDRGLVLIQDKNSQRVVEYLDLKDDMSVLDCCCGPGTKTSQISDLMNNKGEIIGIELHESRAQATKDLLSRWGSKNAKIITSDLLEYSNDKLFDRILLDAPCSGLGVLSHKHDLRYHIKPGDLDDLESLQAEMLDHVSSMVKVGGIILYATCTLNKKENEKQIEKFLKRHSNFEVIEEKTFNPVEEKGDGFYIAQCRRTC